MPPGTEKGKFALNLAFNEALFGEPHAGTDMTFNFPKLIEHAAKTDIYQGSIIDLARFQIVTKQRLTCIAEKRMLEIIAHGKPSTPFMQIGDRIRIEMLDENQQSIFGAIQQKVVAYDSAI